ncbi:alkaline phosphatase D family protein [Comamonas sp. UBA7528]|uniref:alkaline phosphatase D family protein n=1 Tax=Comamonas sp. UBA7528 TaxID=1946391 RepID=UPI0025BC4AB4|nr:alkaline phosphatase D family protein [Comamonas sp. UBA7528]
MTLPLFSRQPPTRRQLLQASCLGSALGLLPAWARSAPAGGIAHPDHDPFTLGVASGDPQPDNVLLWTRLTPPAHWLGQADAPQLSALTVRWELAHDPGFRRIAASGQAQALPEWGHAVHVQVNGLAAGRSYFYRFMQGDATSTTGRCCTAPAPGATVQRLRLAFASCQRWEHGHYAAWRSVVQDQPDLVLFLGDYIYEYAQPAKTEGLARPQPLPTARTLQDYRDRYALHKSDPLLQAAHAQCNWSVIWDDHEVENDYAADQGLGEATAFLARRMAAWQAFYENMPLRAGALQRSMQGLQLYRSLHWGSLARFHLLDGRQYRSPQACRTPGKADSGSVHADRCPKLFAPARSFLGREQEAWLGRQLQADSRHRAEAARWSVVAQTTLFTARRRPSGAQSTDSWDGYPAARQRLTRQIADAAPHNSVLLGGDIHQNYVCAVPTLADRPLDKDNPVLASEFCGTSISSRSGTSQDKVDALRAHNPQVLLARCEERGYSLVDITPQTLRTQLRAVADPLSADSPVYTLAQFVVESGKAGPVAA